MKKTVACIIFSMLLMAQLTGCSKTAAKSTQAEGLNENETTDTRIYKDMAGREVTIPMKPERIVTVNMTGEAVSLGMKPVGAADNWLSSLEDSQKAGIESIGTVGNLNMEKIISLKPDLIITPVNVTKEETIEALSKIAPTVVGPFFGDSLENLLTVGDLLGKTEEAQKWISDYENKAENTKKQLSGTIKEGGTALLIQLSSSKSIYIYPASTWPTIYQVLGLKLPDGEELKEIKTGQELSMEKLSEYDPDYIFVTGTNDDATNKYKQELMDSSVFRNLKAAKNNQVYSLGSRISAGDVTALSWALDEVVRGVEETRNE